MGDRMEVTTWPKHLNAFYKITGSSLSVEIKASGHAAIGLSRKPGWNCECWIVIGDGLQTWIKQFGSNHRESAMTPGILSMEEYRRFWLTWGNGRLCFGPDGSTNAILSCSCNVANVNYVTFSVLSQRNPVHWRFDIPPMPENIKYRPIVGGDLHWIQYDEELPEEALVGGYENESLFIARAKHRGSLTPGKYVPSRKKAYISWGCVANEKDDFEILCGFDGVWVPAIGNKIPVGALVAGYSENNHERLYVGRAQFEGHLIPGKVQPSHKVCYVSYQGKEVSEKTYEILVSPDSDQSFWSLPDFPDRYIEAQEMENYYEAESDFSNETDEIEEPVYIF